MDLGASSAIVVRCPGACTYCLGLARRRGGGAQVARQQSEVERQRVRSNQRVERAHWFSCHEVIQ